MKNTNVKKKTASLLLVIVLMLTAIPLGILEANAADLNNSVGWQKQSTSISCKAAAAANALRIITGRNYNDKDLFAQSTGSTSSAAISSAIRNRGDAGIVSIKIYDTDHTGRSKSSQLQLINESLDKGIPVVAEVKGSSDQHWVTVYGRDGNNYHIYDVGTGTHKWISSTATSTAFASSFGDKGGCHGVITFNATKVSAPVQTLENPTILLQSSYITPSEGVSFTWKNVGQSGTRIIVKKLTGAPGEGSLDNEPGTVIYDSNNTVGDLSIQTLSSSNLNQLKNLQGGYYYKIWAQANKNGYNSSYDTSYFLVTPEEPVVNMTTGSLVKGGNVTFTFPAVPGGTTRFVAKVLSQGLPNYDTDVTDEPGATLIDITTSGTSASFTIPETAVDQNGNTFSTAGKYIKVWTGARVHLTGRNYTWYSATTILDTYNISYNANGGSNAPANQSKIQNTPLTLSNSKPTRTGYTFLGWSENSTATSASYQAGGSFNSNESTTLYAVWEANTYTIKYNANGGSGAMSDSIHTFNVGKTLSTNTFTKTGYTFVGWATSSTENVTYANNANVLNLSSIKDSVYNLYAVWTQNPTVTIFYNANGGTNTPESQSKTQDVDLTLSSTIPIRNGYTFLGWSENNYASSASYQAGGTFTNNDNTTLYAVWQANSYLVKYDANGGKGTMSDSIHTYDSFKSLATNTFTKTGHTFIGWGVDALGSVVYSNQEVVLNLCSENASIFTLYAVWQADTYSVNFDTNGGEVNVGSINVTYGDTYGNLPNAERYGFIFNGWYTASEGGIRINSSDVINITESITLYAQWSEYPTIVKNTPYFSVATIGGSAGSRVSVEISMENNPGIVSTVLKVDYDKSQLKLVDVIDGGIMGIGTFTPGYNYDLVPYGIVWEDSLSPVNHSEDGILVTLVFDIGEDATSGFSPIEISYDIGSTFNSDLDYVEFVTVDGGVNIINKNSGDANGDGMITLMDVAYIRRWLAGGYDVNINLNNSDVNNDGMITLMDVALIRRYLAGGYDVELN